MDWHKCCTQRLTERPTAGGRPSGLTLWVLDYAIMLEVVNQPVLVVHGGKHARTSGTEPGALRRRR